MASGSDLKKEREKRINVLKWAILVGDLVVAATLVLVFNGVGTWIYAVATALAALGIFDFFVLVPWMFKLGQKKPM